MNRKMFKALMKFLGSLQLALILMLVIVVASISGTLYESKFNAEVAREYIYDAPWFNLWLGLLCVNLFSVVVVRYPWKPHHTGFIITHAGIITLLIGAMIDRNYGIEGYLHLTRGEDGTSTMELNIQELRVYAQDSEKYGATTFHVKAMTTPAKRHFAACSPVKDVKVSVIDVRPVIVTSEIEPAAKGKPALSFVLQGAMMGRNEFSLFLGDEQSMGLATVGFKRGMPPPIADKSTQPEKSAKVPRRERIYVFANNNEPMVRTLAGEPTGAIARLHIDQSRKSPQLHLKFQNKEFTFSLEKISSDDISLQGLEDWKLKIAGYYPNFHFDDGKPSTLNDAPENPAALIELIGPLVDDSAAPRKEMPHGSAPRDAVHSGAPNTLNVFLGDDGKLRYHAASRAKGEQSGEIAINKPVQLGWATGVEFIPVRYFDKAVSKQAWKSGPREFAPDAPGLGLLCRVESGGESADVWVGKAGIEDGRTARAKVNGKSIELAFGNSTYELPFSVALLKFEAPRQEGLENSSSFIEFKSTLSFEGDADAVRLKPDSKTAKELKRTLLEGAILEVTRDEIRFQQPLPARDAIEIPMSDVEKFEKNSHEISMNRPTTFPVSSIAPWLGTNYKFSQAGHDFLNNPDYSGVQVLRDPGWLPEWLGSLMICFGIFTMFYLKPYFRREPAPVLAQAP